MVLIVDESISEEIKLDIKDSGFDCYNIGRVVKKESESVVYS